MIIKSPVTQEQLRARQAAVDKAFQSDLNHAYDYVLTDLMARVSDLERKEADNNAGGTDS